MEDEKDTRDEDAGSGQPHIRLAIELRPDVAFLATVLEVY